MDLVRETVPIVYLDVAMDVKLRSSYEDVCLKLEQVLDARWC